MTMPMNKKPVYGQLKVLRKLNEYEFAVELDILRNGKNRNFWDYQRIEDYYLTFVGQPILCAYIGNTVADGHNMSERINPQTGEKYYSFMDGTAERIVGTLSDDPNDFSLIKRDGYTWIHGKGRLFKFYAPELVDKLVRTGRMEVSAETEVTESHKEGDVDVFTQWAGLGVTILNEKVAPAVPGANIAVLAAMRDEFNEVKLKAAAFRANAEKDARESLTKIQKHEGVKHMNRQALTRLAPKFEGYRIVGLSEDGLHVALIDDKGAAYEYNFLAEDNGEVLSFRMKPACFNGFIGEGETAMAVDVDDIIGHCIEANVNSVEKENGDIRALRAELDAANARIAAMQEAEDKRRVSAAKAKLNATLEDFNRNRKEKMDVSALSAVSADIEAGVYTNCLDKDGNWIGESKVETDVLAICCKSVMAYDGKIAENSRKVSAWETMAPNSEKDDGTIGGMLAKWGLEAAKAE